MSPLYGFSEHLCRTFDTVSWQTTVLFGFVALVSLVFRRAPANFRYVLWCLVLLRLCIPAGFSLPVEIGADLRETAEPLARAAMAPLQHTTAAAARSVAATVGRPGLPQEAALTLLWISVVAGGALFAALRGRQARRFLKNCAAVERAELEELAHQLKVRCGIKRAISLGVYPDTVEAKGPCVTGILRPCILLPRHMAEEWPADALEPVLLHELAHIKRHDLLVNLVQIAVQIVYFFHPLVWLANWRIRALREEVCDDLAVFHMQRQKKRYGASFLRVIEETQREPALALCPLHLSEARSPLGRRVVRIMSKDYVYHRKLGVSGFAALAAVVIAAAGAAGVDFTQTGFLDQAQRLFNEQRHEEAIALLQDTAENAPAGSSHRLAALDKMGLMYMWLDQDQKALDVLTRAVEKSPNQKGAEAAWFHLGEAYNRLGLLDEAFDAWEKCIQLCPGRVQPDQFPWRDAAGYSMLAPAENLYKAGHYEEAIKWYTRVYQEFPAWKNAPDAMMMIGICYERSGECEKALAALELAAGTYPDRVGWSEAIWFYLGRSYEGAGRADEALEAYQKSVELAGRCSARKPDGFPWADASARIGALSH